MLTVAVARADSSPDGSALDRYGVEQQPWYSQQTQQMRGALETLQDHLRAAGALGFAFRGDALVIYVPDDADAQLTDEQFSKLILSRAKEDPIWAETVRSAIPKGTPILLARVTAPVAATERSQPRQAPSQAERLLDQYTRDLTREAKEGKLDPVIGRDAEIGRIFQLLSRRKKSNVAIVGDAGVGKTAIVEGAAQWIARGRVPERFVGRGLRALQMSKLIAGTTLRGEFEERLQKVLAALEQTEDILFIDEMHAVVGAGAGEGALDATTILKPALARGGLMVIGATTLDEFRKSIEKDAALERRFSKIDVEEPTREQVGEIVAKVQPRYEEHHGVRFSPEAVSEIVESGSSRRYLPERRAPDKALDFMDEAAARVANPLEEMVSTAERGDERGDADRRRDVSAQDVRAVIESMTGIPVASREQRSRQANELPALLGQEVLGQPEAVEAVSRVNHRYVAGLQPEHRPIGTFLFFGGTGTGKTFLPERVAAHLLGDPEAVVRIDMTEYREKHTVSRLLGAPPGYVGHEGEGQLTGAIRRRPYSVVVFDEIEKAAPEVLTALLQVLDKGEMTDGQGRKVDFRNTLIFMTSNAGQAEMMRAGRSDKRIGFGTGADESAVVKLDLTEHFLPEFVNRVDEVVSFRAIDGARGPKVQLAQGVDHSKPAPDAPLLREKLDQEIRGWQQHVKNTRGVTFEVTDAAKERLVGEGYEPKFGMRPLLRAVSKRMLTPLAQELNAGRARRGHHYVIDAAGPGRAGRFTVREAQPTARTTGAH